MAYMETEHHDRVWARVDLDAIEFNMESMHRNLKPGTKMCPAIKADGYGHGALRIAQRLEPREDIWGFALATVEEAMELREGGITKPLLILGYTFPYSYDIIAKSGIRPTVFRGDMLEELSAAAVRAGQIIPVHFAVDTGMSRIGIRPDDEGLRLIEKAARMPGLAIEGIFTHFSKADEVSRENTERQIREFRAFCDRAEAHLGYRIPIHHCSNSAGIVSYTEANMDMVRPGITVYGLWPSAEVPRDIVPLKPAMALYSHVSFVKSVPAGTAVSYGGTYITDQITTLATIPMGYGDGYARGLSNKGYVLIRGQRAPIRGRVCMDQFMVDVTAIPGAAEGDLVTLLGTDGEETITMEDLAGLSGRFNYEFACCITPRVPRIYE